VRTTRDKEFAQFREMLGTAAQGGEGDNSCRDAMNRNMERAVEEFDVAERRLFTGYLTIACARPSKGRCSCRSRSIWPPWLRTAPEILFVGRKGTPWLTDRSYLR
jgi:hypothetical protein